MGRKYWLSLATWPPPATLMPDAHGEGSSASVSLRIQEEHSGKAHEACDREGESRATAGGRCGSTEGFCGRDQKQTGVAERRAKVQEGGVSEGEK